MPDIFGAPAGISQAESDIRAEQMHGIAMRRGAVDLRQAELALSQQEKMLQLMNQAPTGGAPATPDDLASRFDSLSDIAFRAGSPEKAKDFALAGTTLRKNAAEIEAKQTEATIKRMNLIGSLLEGVNDETSWRQANAMYQMETNQPSPYAQMPYDPALVDKLRMGALNAKDRALAGAAEARRKASLAEEKERERRTNELIPAQAALARVRATVLGKVGATGKMPTNTDLKAITDLITRDYGGALPPEDARVVARPIAERSLDLMQTQNLSRSEAANRAYQEAKERGDFVGLRERGARRGTLGSPLPLPKAGEEPKANVYYEGTGPAAGALLLYNPQTKKFRVAIPAASAADVREGALSDETEDEEAQ